MFLFQKLCRLCTTLQDVSSTLTNLDSDDMIILEKLNTIAPGILETNSNLPNGVCASCVIQLNEAYTFIKNCIKSQAILKLNLEELQRGKITKDSNEHKIQSNITSEVTQQTNSDNIPQTVENQISILRKILNKEDNYFENKDDIVFVDNLEFVEVHEEVTEYEDEIIQENIDEATNQSSEIDVLNVDDILILGNNDTDTDLKNGNVCEIWDKSFKDIFELKLHVDTHMNGSVGKFEICDKILNSNSKKKQYICQTCDRAFTERINFRKHTLTHKISKYRTRHTREKSLDKVYKCTICKKRFTTNYKLKIHFRIHTDECQHKCYICDKAFSNLSDVKAHIGTHSLEKSFKCEICGRAYIRRSHLRNHFIFAHKNQTFKCNVCGQELISKKNLSNHMQTHSSKKAYQCELCGKGLHSELSLKKHMNTHTHPKVYKCEVCEKDFDSKFDLKIHTYIHTHGKEKS